MGARIKKEAAIGTGVLGIIQIICGLVIVICCVVFSGLIKAVVTPYWSAIPVRIIKLPS